MEFNFSKKNVIVTGGGSGIGASIALEFAKAGANVIVVDVNVDKAREVANSIAQYEGVSSFARVDMTKYGEVEALVSKTVASFGSVDILINCAGICLLEPIIDMDITNLDRVVDIDLKGTIYGCKAVLPVMKQNGYGKIVNMSSIAGKLCGANASIYSCVKTAIMGFTASIAREFARDGINVNCILPGIIRTSMWEGMLDDMTRNGGDREEVFTSFTDTIPQGYPQEPVDIANMTLFLCSDEAKTVTGQNIGVDGGQTY